MQGMVGPDWRVGAWTLCSIPTGTAGWACLIILGAPSDGGEVVRTIIVIIGVVIALVSIALYLCTACTDPGIVFKHTAQPVTASSAMPHAIGGGHRAAAAAAMAEAPAGAGTPVRYGLADAKPTPLPTAGNGLDPAGRAGSIPGEGFGLGGSGNWGGGSGDVEQGHERQRSGVPAVGLPPDQCEVAADSGSGAVVDMRNAPPITSPMWAGGPATVGAAAAAAVAAPAAVVVAATAAAAGFPHNSQRGVASVGTGAAGARAPVRDDRTVCGRCQIYRPPRAVHCTSCDVCVERLDHHCPFMGQCVGRKTLASFYMFVVAIWVLVCYVALSIGYLVVSVVVSGL